jgi:hypothetical protein
MKKFLLSAAVISVFATIALSTDSNPIQEKQAVSVDEAYAQSMKSYKAAETAEEKLAIAQKFLKEFPDSTYTPNVLNTALRHMAETGQNSDDSIAFFVEVRSKISDPEVGTQLDLRLIRLLVDNGKTTEFRTLALQLAENDLLKFYDCVRVIQYCYETNQFDLIQTLADKAQPFANAESVRADSRSKDQPDEIYEMWGNDRQALLLMVYAMIKTKQGLFEEGLADFAKAEGLALKNIFGLPTDQYPLHQQWGLALMEKGDHREAFDKLALVALVMGNAEAYTALRQAYVGFNGSEEGFEAYALSVQQNLVPKIEDFTLPGYDGKDHSLAELRSKVTLVNFWHPT